MGKRTRRFPDRAGKTETRNISIDFSPSSLITKNYRYTFSSSGFFTIPDQTEYAPQFRRMQIFPLTLQIYFRSSVTAEFLNHVPKLSFSSRILMFFRCTALRMFSVKTLMIYSQSFTVTHLNSEKEKQG